MYDLREGGKEWDIKEEVESDKIPKYHTASP